MHVHPEGVLQGAVDVQVRDVQDLEPQVLQITFLLVWIPI